jgi:hypothetical protein
MKPDAMDGVFGALASHELEPLWYHLVFLGLLMPATLVGGRPRAS